MGKYQRTTRILSELRNRRDTSERVVSETEIDVGVEYGEGRNQKMEISVIGNVHEQGGGRREELTEYSGYSHAK